MRISIVMPLIYLLCFSSVDGQDNRRYWVFFTDNDADEIPVAEAYIDSVLAVTDSITVRSRWLNAISVPALSDQLEKISSFSFVKSIQPVARMARPEPIHDRIYSDDIQSMVFNDDTYYGHATTQIKIHGIHILQNAGITGDGITIGFLDTGYRWDQHIALQNANVIAERDFVAEHYIDDELPPSHYTHGTLVFSVVAGYDPGTFVGVAPDAYFLLGATEDIRTETPIEEDFWVAGIEWMAEMGVDIVSTSLGYSIFDEPYDSYTPDDMDGKTAVTTVAADRAFEEGILVIASAGNSGHTDWRIITSPADGEYVIAAGAVDPNQTIAPFSSRGPSADGRIKPDVSAMGIDVVGALTNTDGYRFASGTSLSAPIISGTAGLVYSARPDLSAGELRNALQMSARRDGEPDNTYGYGLLDAPAALAYPVLRVSDMGEQLIQVYLTGNDGIDEESAMIHIRTSNEQDYIPYPLTVMQTIEDSGAGLYEYRTADELEMQSLHFVVTVTDGSGNIIRYPRNAAQEFYISPVHDLIAVIQRVVPERFALHQNFPNPFNDRTVLRFELPDDNHVSITVYDILGRHITSLTDEFYLAGVHEVIWQPTAQASGVYFYRIQYGTRNETGRMIYLK